MFAFAIEQCGLQNSELLEPENPDYLASMSAELGGVLAPVRDLVASVVPLDGRKVRILWRSGLDDIVDLRPLLVRHRRSPVASSELMFRTVRPGREGRSIVWDDGSEIGLSWLQDLALTRMTNREFREALATLEWTVEEASAHLGVSRRSVAAYRLSQEVPRAIAMSVRFMILRRARSV